MTGFEEWAQAKSAQARDAGTYTRTHGDGCWTRHLDCAQAEIARLRAALATGRAAYADIHPEDAA